MPGDDSGIFLSSVNALDEDYEKFSEGQCARSAFSEIMCVMVPRTMHPLDHESATAKKLVEVTTSAFTLK